MLRPLHRAACLTTCRPPHLYSTPPHTPATLSLEFDQIVELLNSVYCLGQLLEFVAFLWLRFRCPWGDLKLGCGAAGLRSWAGGTRMTARVPLASQRCSCAAASCSCRLLPRLRLNPPFLGRYPDLHRPYRIPLSNWGCVAMLTPACVLLTGLLLVPWAKVGHARRRRRRAGGRGAATAGGSHGCLLHALGGGLGAPAGRRLQPPP